MFQGETGELKLKARERQEAEMFNTLKLLQTRFNTRTTENNDKIEWWQARTQKSHADYERNMKFLRNISLQNAYTVCFE